MGGRRLQSGVRQHCAKRIAPYASAKLAPALMALGVSTRACPQCLACSPSLSPRTRTTYLAECKSTVHISWKPFGSNLGVGGWASAGPAWPADTFSFAPPSLPLFCVWPVCSCQCAAATAAVPPCLLPLGSGRSRVRALCGFRFALAVPVGVSWPVCS